ncbi:MAG: redox-sensing transcriptional repressor Rex [Candidatus Muiribacteriota bacterium]
MKTNIKSYPDAALKRLPLYYNVVCEAKERGKNYISAQFIADKLALKGIQVRKDISLTGIIGKPRVGYKVEELFLKLQHFLGYNNQTEAFLVGAGYLGYALLGYSGFEKLGLKIVAAFDLNPNKQNIKINGKVVFPLNRFKNLALRMKIKVGVITVPENNAQEVADLMVESNIRGIWNFASLKLNVPDNVIVQNVNLASDLSVLIKKLEESASFN